MSSLEGYPQSRRQNRQCFQDRTIHAQRRWIVTVYLASRPAAGGTFGRYRMSSLIGLLVAIVLVGVPVWRILTRLGLSPWFTILAFIPVVNIISLWLLSYANWPGQRSAVQVPNM